jgi:hypothetical protein
MGMVSLQYDMYTVQGKFKHLCLPRSEFQRFNAGILGLGDVSREGKHFDTLAAFFDLEGFTSFCNQTDPQLVIPEYLDQLLHWLFFRLTSVFVKEQHKDTVVLWGKFPFFAKFLGDGILFLWDTSGLGSASMGNIVVNLERVCRAYVEEFLPEMSKSLSKVPARLRCGIARGEVIAIGGGKDFVGSCINVASRLQKVGQLSFVFARKGLNPEDCFSSKWQSEFSAKQIRISGIDHEETVLILRKEFEGLTEEEKSFFREP